MLARHVLILNIMKICNLIKIPTTKYVNATLKRWGHDFVRIRGGIFKCLSQWGKTKSQRENPSNCQLPFLSYSPNNLLLLEVGWVRYCMGHARYDNPNSNWRSHQFLGNAFWLLGQVKTKRYLPIPSCIHGFGDFRKSHSHLKVSCVFFPMAGKLFF